MWIYEVITSVRLSWGTNEQFWLEIVEKNTGAKWKYFSQAPHALHIKLSSFIDIAVILLLWEKCNSKPFLRQYIYIKSKSASWLLTINSPRWAAAVMWNVMIIGRSSVSKHNPLFLVQNILFIFVAEIYISTYVCFLCKLFQLNLAYYSIDWKVICSIPPLAACGSPVREG